MSDVIMITPGAGSFVDAFGNVFSIDAANYDTADINGQPITPNGESSFTGALELSNGSVYGQDENSGQWYLLASKGTPGLWEWQPASPPPSPTVVGSSETIVLSPSDTTTAALGTDQAAMAFVGGGSSDATAASSSSTDSSQAANGLLAPADFPQSNGDSVWAGNSSRVPLQAAPDQTAGTMLSVGTWHITDYHGVTAIHLG